MPQMVLEGRVFKALPPLYGLPDKTGKKVTFFTERIDYIKYVQKLFAKENKVCYDDNKAITPAELTKILYINADYTYETKCIANRYAIDPELLETLLLLHLSGANYKKIKSSIEKKYRFIKVSTINGTTSIQGSLNRKIQTIFNAEKVINDCSRIIDILNNNKKVSFKINGELTTLYGLMDKFDQTSPNNIRRYKGLGEMDGPALRESTLSFDNRTLIQYTIEDVKFVTEEIRYYEDNKEKLLEGIQVSRFDVIG
jgi:DNA gyrase/topoisomerase IV subunit B